MTVFAPIFVTDPRAMPAFKHIFFIILSQNSPHLLALCHTHT